MHTARIVRSLTLGLASLAGLVGAGFVNPPLAAAQDGPSVQTAAFVRVVAESSRIWERRGRGDVLVTVPQGTIIETLTKDRGYYWVLLDRDDYGTCRAGFILLSDIEPLTGEESASRMRGEHGGNTDRGEVSLAATLVDQPPDALGQATAHTAPPAAAVEAPKQPASATTTPRRAAGKALCEVMLHFEFGKSDLLDEARQQIARTLAELQGDLQGASYKIEGYADAVGTEPYNEQLGQARAETVKQFLATQHHVPLDRMTIVSYGESRPVAPNATKEGRAMNRRVFLKILG